MECKENGFEREVIFLILSGYPASADLSDVQCKQLITMRSLN